MIKSITIFNVQHNFILLIDICEVDFEFYFRNVRLEYCDMFYRENTLFIITQPGQITEEGPLKAVQIEDTNHLINCHPWRLRKTILIVNPQSTKKMH